MDADIHSIVIGRDAMACRFEIVFNAGEHSQDTESAILALDTVDEIEKLKTERASAPEGCTCAKPLLVGALLRAYPARDYGPEHDPGCPASTD